MLSAIRAAVSTSPAKQNGAQRRLSRQLSQRSNFSRLSAQKRFAFRCAEKRQYMESQQHRFQFEKCAQQFIRMDNVAAPISAMSVNNPTPAISGNGAAVTP
jgi:UDP-3-O-[3-hydroxymyristoyl] glucosamine N-acyltransferase